MVETVYNAADQVSQLIAKNPTTGDRVTQYIYGTTLADSELARNDLLAAEIYPDAVDSTDRVSYTYDRTGARTSMTDQNGSVHEYDYDALGRRTADRVTNLATGIDDSVLRIETSYEVRGLAESVTSYDAATSGSVVNQVQYEYNDYGQLITEYEAHDGAVNTGTTPKVQYSYENGSANTIRSTGFTYPNGNTLTHGYGTASSDADMLSRIEDLIHSLSPSDPITYSYFGLGSVYKIDYTEPQVALDYATGSGSNPYAALDPFGRVTDMNWENYGTNTSLDHIQYGYDRASNRTWRKNLVAPAGFDELYSYDGLHRLKSAERGQLSNDESRIESNFEFHQAWDLDATGNWSGFDQFDQDFAADALVQQRIHNKVNEITAIGETVGPRWVTPSHDRNGNMTVVPHPATSMNFYDAVYDSWNRLIKLIDSSSSYVVSIYYYDAVNRRIKIDEYDAGTYQNTRRYYFNYQWQNLEEQSSHSSSVQHQYGWGSQYVDQLHFRLRDTDNSDVLDEQLFIVQDGNWNVISICGDSGLALERYSYSPYGNTTAFDPVFSPLHDSHYDTRHAFEGRYLNDAGLYYYRNRYYSSMLGRFLTPDSFSFADGLNLYQFVHSSPLDSLDPFGTTTQKNTHCCCCCRIDTANIWAITPFKKIKPRLGQSFVGHSYNVLTYLDYEPVKKESDAKDCTFEWWEWVSIGYKSKHGPDLPAGVWKNMFPGHIEKNPTLKEWREREKPCPGRERAMMTDEPSIPLVRGRRDYWNVDRYLWIVIRFIDGCPNPKTKVLALEQRLSTRKGRWLEGDSYLVKKDLDGGIGQPLPF